MYDGEGASWPALFVLAVLCAVLPYIKNASRSVTRRQSLCLQSGTKGGIVMPLWTAAVLFFSVALGALVLLLQSRHKEKKPWMLAALIAAAVISLALASYMLLTLIFANAAQTSPPDNLPVTAETLAPAPSPTPELVAPEPMPADYDLPTAEVPALHPDVLGLQSLSYEETPTLGTQNDVTQYVLHQFLNDRFSFSFHLTRALATDDGTGYGVLSRACETAMSYYLFSAYNEFDMYTEDQGAPDRVYAKITLNFTKADYDLEARAEALEFVLKNPVPVGGFQDFASEKAYAQRIHDFIARKITYSPIGFEPELMLGMEKYEALQEAYNVLAQEEETAVCAGYARAFALVAQYAGINAAWVFGNETETESHAWNVLYPCDGSEPVLIDVTWDDGESPDFPGQSYVSDRYFYISLSRETEHSAAPYFSDFLRFVNGK